MPPDGIARHGALRPAPAAVQAAHFRWRRQGNGINESLSVEADGQGMYLKAMMSMHRMASSEEPKLSFEGAAEYYWSMLVDRLQ